MTIPQTVSIHIPFQITKRGGRKEMVLPAGAQLQRPRTDNTVVKALARAFRWKRLLETGAYTSVSDLAEKEKIGLSYLTRVLRMTLLAPDIVDAILDGRQGDGIDLATLAAPFPNEWGGRSDDILASTPDGVHLSQNRGCFLLTAATLAS